MSSSGWTFLVAVCVLFLAAGAAAFGFGSMNGHGAHIGRPMFWITAPLFVALLVRGIARLSSEHPGEPYRRP